MKWMKERDLLIAQTMAFVESVTGKKPGTEFFVETQSIEIQKTEASVSLLPAAAFHTTDNAASTPDIAALLAMTNMTAGATAPSPKPVPVLRPDLHGDFQSEIKARVATFRANQERFTREREAYCSATMNRIQATLQGSEQPPRQGK